MSDLSWLNPTPHAIAVYASQPLSPVATQHSLPSGRYSLLGPDFHRLDRTSFAWRTHSITSSAPAMSVGGTVRPIAFAVLRLMTSSNLVGCKMGRSAGFSRATGAELHSCVHDTNLAHLRSLHVCRSAKDNGCDICAKSNGRITLTLIPKPSPRRHGRRGSRPSARLDSRCSPAPRRHRASRD